MLRDFDELRRYTYLHTFMAPDLVLSCLARLLARATYLRCMPVLATNLLLVPDSSHHTSSQGTFNNRVRRG